MRSEPKARPPDRLRSSPDRALPAAMAGEAPTTIDVTARAMAVKAEIDLRKRR